MYMTFIEVIVLELLCAGASDLHAADKRVWKE